MNTDHAELLERLEEFSFDAPDASFPFSAKLACENGWSNHFTKRVIKEYRRFAFLSVAAGHPVSPSEAVDQAWHLHLTYTLNYWKQFCGETLRRPLHHMPSKGGIQEKQKYDDWYQQTLASYRRLFGSEPPADIWPTVEIRKETKPEFARVDRTSHWVIPKPRLKFFMPALVGGSGVLMLLFCCGATMGNGLNPFNWRGPDFLVFYFW